MAAAPFEKLEPYWLLILIGILFVLPMLGAQFGIDLSIVSHLIAVVTGAIIDVIVQITGNA